MNIPGDLLRTEFQQRKVSQYTWFTDACNIAISTIYKFQTLY